jgi:chromosome segregation ATPase
VAVQGNLADKGRQMQQVVRDAADGVSAACESMRDLQAHASHSKDRLVELEAERDYLQAEVNEHSSAAASARDDAARLQVLLIEWLFCGLQP